MHYKAHPGYCFDCGQSYGTTVEEFVQHHRDKHIKKYPFVCEKCGESMSRNQQYITHMEAHGKHVPQKFQCKQCDKDFTTNAEYKKHMDSPPHNEGRPEYWCEYCGLKVLGKLAFQQHLKMVHKEGKLRQTMSMIS